MSELRAAIDTAEKASVDKVVINEGVNLAKTYGPTDAFKFINGVLDKVAVDKRAIEVAANKRK